jgi:uncharacterized protein (DUF2384 family)
MAEDMGVSRRTLYDTLGIARATADRKIKTSATLDVAETEAVLGMAQLVAQVQTIVEESGNPEGFDAPQWVARWLADPHPALGGLRPRDLMATAPGRETVYGLIEQIQSGAYA